MAKNQQKPETKSSYVVRTKHNLMYLTSHHHYTEGSHNTQLT